MTMKPVHTYTGYTTMDLTACVVHALQNDDGSTRIVACYPKKWVALEKQPMMSVSGPVQMRPYHVTEWHEVLLATVPASSG